VRAAREHGPAVDQLLTGGERGAAELSEAFGVASLFPRFAQTAG
jgi:hypothetical protein